MDLCLLQEEGTTGICSEGGSFPGGPRRLGAGPGQCHWQSAVSPFSQGAQDLSARVRVSASWSRHPEPPQAPSWRI